MTALSDNQLIAKANVIGNKTEENTIDPTMVAQMFKDIILNKYNTDEPLPEGPQGPQGEQGPAGSPDTGAMIVDKLAAIEDEEDKLPSSALQGTGLNSLQFEKNKDIDAWEIMRDATPTKGSMKFLASADLFKYEASAIQGRKPRAFTFSETADTKEVSFRKIIGRRGCFYAISSNGTGNRFYVSQDGKLFIEGGATGSLEYYGMDISDQGTIILVARSGGPGNIRRSTDGGITFSTITAPGTYTLTSVKHIALGKWVACARSGEALYSTDDGASWTAATADGANDHMGIDYSDGQVVMVSQDGTDRVQLSDDFGVTYTATSPPTNRIFHGVTFFKGKIILRRGGVSSAGYITVSEDKGTTWSEKLTPDDPDQETSGMSVIGDYLYLYGADGFILRTSDLESYETLTPVTANKIAAMGWTIMNGFPVAMFGCDTGDDEDRVFSTL
ncbi:hypothetical protein GCM10027284_09010 [Cyclobacterium sediminis]